METSVVNKISETDILDINEMDLESVRCVRAIKQFHFYHLDESDLTHPLLADLRGKTIEERFFLSRRSTLPQLKNDVDNSTQELVTRKFNDPTLPFPPPKYTEQILFPIYIQTFNEIYSRINEESDSVVKEKMAFKFVGAIYTLGILIHPAIDGNGQTFKNICLSYIHEFCPNYNLRFFPLKISDYLHNVDIEITTPFTKAFTEIPVSELIPKDTTDERLIKLMRMINAIDHIDPSETNCIQQIYNLDLKAYQLILDCYQDLEIPELLNELIAVDQKSPRRLGRLIIPFSIFDKTLGKQKVPNMVRRTIRQNVYKILISKGHSEAMAYHTSFLFKRPQDNASNAVFTLLENPAFLHEYILRQETNLQSENNDIDKVFDVARIQFDAVGNEIKSLLTNDKVSSREAITSQVSLAREYYEFANEFSTMIQEINYDSYSVLKEARELMKSRGMKVAIEFMRSKLFV